MEKLNQYLENIENIIVFWVGIFAVFFAFAYSTYAKYNENEQVYILILSIWGIIWTLISFSIMITKNEVKI